MNVKNKQRVVTAIQEIDELVALGEEGLARTEETDTLRTSSRILLEKLIDMDSIQGRKYDKWRRQPHWHTQSRDNFAVENYCRLL